MADGKRFESIWADLRGVSFSQGWLDAGGVRTRYLHGVGAQSRGAQRALFGLGDRPDRPRLDRPATTGLEIPNSSEHVPAFLKVASRLAVGHPGKVDRLVLNTAGGSQADRSES